MKKKMAQIGVLIIGILIVLWVAVPPILESLFVGYLYDTLDNRVSLRTLNGAKFSFYRGFSIREFVVDIPYEQQLYSVSLQNVSFSARLANGDLTKPQALINSVETDVVTISPKSDTLKTINEDDLLFKSNSLLFSGSMTLRADTVFYVNKTDTLRVTTASIKRKGERDYLLSAYDARLQNSWKSGYLELEVYGLHKTSIVEPPLFLEKVPLDTLFPRNSSVKKYTSFVDSLVQHPLVLKADSLQTELHGPLNQLYGDFFSHFDFDSLALKNSISTFRRASGKLTDLTWWSVAWKREKGDVVDFSMPHIRDQSLGAADSLLIHMNVVNGTLYSGRLSCIREGWKYNLNASLPDRVDSGDVSLMLMRKLAVDKEESNVLPFEFDTVQFEISGAWRETGEWEAAVHGGVRHIDLLHLISDTLPFDSLTIDTVLVEELRISSEDIRVQVGNVRGQVDSLSLLMGDLQYQYGLQKGGCGRVELYDNRGVALCWLDTLSLDTSRGFSIAMDTLQYKNITLKQAHSKVAKLWSSFLKGNLLTLDTFEIVVNSLYAEDSTDRKWLQLDSIVLNRQSGNVALRAEVVVLDTVIQGAKIAVNAAIVDSLLAVKKIAGDTLNIKKDLFTQKHLNTRSIPKTLTSIGAWFSDTCEVSMKHGGFRNVGDLDKAQVRITTSGDCVRASGSIKQLHLDTLGLFSRFDFDVSLKKDTLTVDSVRVSHKGMPLFSTGWVQLNRNMPCSLRVAAGNLKLSDVSAAILQGNGRVTGAGAALLTFSGQLMKPKSWEGTGAFTLKNVRVRGLDVQSDSIVNIYAKPFKDVHFEHVRCNPFVLNKGQRIHIKHIEGRGDKFNFLGWGNLSRDGYFYLDMKGTVKKSTMKELPRLARMALNDGAGKTEGDFHVKMAGTPKKQELVTEKGLGGKVIRSYFRNFGASVRKIFE